MVEPSQYAVCITAVIVFLVHPDVNFLQKCTGSEYNIV